MRARRRVLVVAKPPCAGRTKTRLTPPVPPDLSARLSTAMLLDTVDACREEADEVGLLCPAPEDVEALRRVVGGGVSVHVQRGHGLGAALREEMRHGTGDGALAIVSSDVPGLPADQVRRAFTLVEADADVVLGPSLDGGYWLIAMSGYHEAPFLRIPWSTPACAAVTLQRSSDAGLRVERVAEWLDLDTLVDLSLAIHAPPGLIGRRTREALSDIAAVVDIPRPPGPRLVDSELVVASPWRSLLRDRLRSEGGGAREYLYLAAPRAVFVVAVTHDGDVLLVRQYRHPVRDWTLEVPAGSVDDGESPLAAARRELSEETGGRAGSWRHLGTFFSSSAHLSLRSDAFLATGVEVGAARPDGDEEIELVRLPAVEALARARQGQMVEGQTALCLLLAAEHLGTRPPL
jgi:rSAM/selenodomain-associated transferase 1